MHYLKRTKCTAIIKNVLGDYRQSILLSKLKSVKFSILIDESTDVSSIKNLGIVCRFVENGSIHDEFLD